MSRTGKLYNGSYVLLLKENVKKYENINMNGDITCNPMTHLHSVLLEGMPQLHPRPKGILLLLVACYSYQECASYENQSFVLSFTELRLVQLPFIAPAKTCSLDCCRLHQYANQTIHT